MKRPHPDENAFGMLYLPNKKIKLNHISIPIPIPFKSNLCTINEINQTHPFY